MESSGRTFRILNNMIWVIDHNVQSSTHDYMIFDCPCSLPQVEPLSFIRLCTPLPQLPYPERTPHPMKGMISPAQLSKLH